MGTEGNYRGGDRGGAHLASPAAGRLHPGRAHACSATVSAVKAVEFIVTSDSTAARDLAAEILTADGFTVRELEIVAGKATIERIEESR